MQRTVSSALMVREMMRFVSWKDDATSLAFPISSTSWDLVVDQGKVLAAHVGHLRSSARRKDEVIDAHGMLQAQTECKRGDSKVRQRPGRRYAFLLPSEFVPSQALCMAPLVIERLEYPDLQSLCV